MVEGTPQLNAAVVWLAQAKLGEVYTYWTGNLEKACANPESLVTAKQRRDMLAMEKRLAREGKPVPERPDPYKEVRQDARAITKWTEAQENRGLVELRCVVLSKSERFYEMECLVQRNGLKSVQARD